MCIVSIIVPNYNHSAFLRQRIDSILQQSFTDFEIILLDDCSTDNSQEILNSYRANPKVTHCIFNEKNSGNTFRQWEKGVQLAQGEFIWIAESDDWCEITLLETLVCELRKNGEIGLAFCQSAIITEPGQLLKEISFFPYYAYYNKGKNFVQEYMLYTNRIINASMVVWRKSQFEKIDEEYKSFRFSGDWLFWISILEISDVFVSGKILNYFRKHAGDVSTKIYRSGENYLEDMRLFEILLRRKILDRSMMVNVVKARYISFLQDRQVPKNSPTSDRIRKAYGAYLKINSISDLGFRILGRFRQVKSIINKSYLRSKPI